MGDEKKKKNFTMALLNALAPGMISSPFRAADFLIQSAGSGFWVAAGGGFKGGRKKKEKERVKGNKEGGGGGIIRTFLQRSCC